MAESRGFEPLDPHRIADFQDQCIKPLCQLSMGSGGYYSPLHSLDLFSNYKIF